MNWKNWGKALLAAVIGGAAQQATTVLASGGAIKISQIGASAGVGAIATALAYIMKSPMPGVSAADVAQSQEPQK